MVLRLEISSLPHVILGGSYKCGCQARLIVQFAAQRRRPLRKSKPPRIVEQIVETGGVVQQPSGGGGWICVEQREDAIQVCATFRNHRQPAQQHTARYSQGD